MTSARRLTTLTLLRGRLRPNIKRQNESSETMRKTGWRGSGKFGGHSQARLRTILVSFSDTNHTIRFFSARIENVGRSPLRRCRRAADEPTIVPLELPSSENAIPLASRDTTTSTGSSRLGPASFMECQALSSLSKTRWHGKLEGVKVKLDFEKLNFL